MAWTISNAMMQDYEISRCLLVPAVESLVVTCSDGAQSAQSNTTPTPDQYYWPDKTTEHSRLSRFGMTCEPLTADRGKDVLTWFLEGFPVRTLAVQEKGQELMENGLDFGRKWQGLLAKYDRDSHSLKTAQCSLIEDLIGCCVILPRWGTLQNGELFLLPKPAHLTSEKEFGLWPTPTVNGNYNRKGLSATSGDGLATAVKMWPTPCATDHKGAGKSGALRDRLDYAVERGATKSNTYATPQARDFRTGQTSRWEDPNRSRNLNDQIGGQLNPTWVEWLMGWPLGWTELKHLETGRFQEWQQQHGAY